MWNRQIKDFNFEETQNLFNDFSKTVTESSLVQYKSAVRRFEEVTGKVILDVTMKEIEDYANRQKNEKTTNAQRNYIKGFMRFAVMQDLQANKSRVDKLTFIYLFVDAKFGIMPEEVLNFIK